MVEESVYRFIIRMSEEQPGLPYSFQVPQAGKYEVCHILFEDKPFFLIRERWASDLLNLVSSCLSSQDTSELLDYLSEQPLVTYLAEFNRRLKLLLAEKLIDATELYAFGIHLATTSTEDDLVKLGMLILGHFENDVSTRIMRTLGLHSALTLYAVEASRNYKSQNPFVYDLFKNTQGYGRLIALHDLEPVRPEQQEWVFNAGVQNHVAANMSAMMCLEKVDMAPFYQNITITKANFSKLSLLLAYAAEEARIQQFAMSLPLVEKYIAVAPSYAHDFIDLAGLVVLHRSMRPYEEDEDINNSYWTTQMEEYVERICYPLIHQRKWDSTVAMELADPQHTTSLTLLVLWGLNMTPKFNQFLTLLERDPFDMDMLKFLLLGYSQHYLDDVYEYLMHIMPEQVYSGPEEISIEEMGSEHQPDIWLMYLLKAMRKGKRYVEPLFLRCLNCRYPDVRTEATRNLWAGVTQWSETVLTTLEAAVAKEPVPAVKDRLLRLLARAMGGGKEHRYIPVDQFLFTTSPGDITMLHTTIAGASHRDLTPVDGELGEGDYLCLVREPENRYDELAILVTTRQGYVLGYIPRRVNHQPATLMDSGEKIYAILRKFDLSQDYLKIEVKLCR